MRWRSYIRPVPQAGATAAADAAQRQKKTAALRQQLRKIDAAENAHAREIENLVPSQATFARSTTWRSRSS